MSEQIAYLFEASAWSLGGLAVGLVLGRVPAVRETLEELERTFHKER